MVAIRGRAVSVFTMCVGVALAGCSSPPSPSPTENTIAPSPQSAAATRKVDLSRLGEIRNAFPSGYPANTDSGPRIRDAQASESVGDLVSYGEPLTVAPESCRALLKPVEAKASTDWASVTSTTGPVDPFIALSVYDPVSMPVALPTSGCDRFTFVVEGGGVPDGRAERLTAPIFEGAVTYALKVVFLVDNSSVEVPLVEYFYTAILDGRTFVNLWARVRSDFLAEPALPDLLKKAVAALRGQ